MLDKNNLPALGYKARVNVTGIVDVFPVFKKSKKVVKYSEYKKRLETLELSVSNLQATKNNLEEKLSDVTWNEKSTILHKIDIYNEQLIEESAEIQTLLKNIESLGSELGYRHDRKNAASG